MSLENRDVIKNRYIKHKMLGKGGFGTVFKVQDCVGNKTRALKCEEYDCTEKILIRERETYKSIGNLEGFVTIYDSFSEGNKRFLVMDCLGDSLIKKFDGCGKKFNLKTVFMIADQLIDRVRCLHGKGFIHGDIKPENLLMGLMQNSHKLYMVDLGLASRFKSKNRHLPMTVGHRTKGTLRYASINCHKGIKLSRRDDLESIAYVLIYLLKGRLPWQGINAFMNTKSAEMLELKLHTPIKDICKDLEPEFSELLQYARNLNYHDKPDYQRFISSFQNLFQHKGYENNHLYYWSPKPVKRKVKEVELEPGEIKEDKRNKKVKLESK